jgi:hypothetical protein
MAEAHRFAGVHLRGAQALRSALHFAETGQPGAVKQVQVLCQLGGEPSLCLPNLPAASIRPLIVIRNHLARTTQRDAFTGQNERPQVSG